MTRLKESLFVKNSGCHGREFRLHFVSSWQSLESLTEVFCIIIVVCYN